MREITVKLYQYSELSEDAKEKARQWFREGYNGSFEWEGIQEDAENVGLEIHELDQHRTNRGEFTTSALECAEKILKDHGKDCEIYKMVEKYVGELRRIAKLEDEEEYSPVLNEEKENTEHEFLHNLLEDYRIMLDHNIEYQNSDEVVVENIEANEYEFTENGKRA